MNNISYMDNLPTDLHEQHYSIDIQAPSCSSVKKKEFFFTIRPPSSALNAYTTSSSANALSQGFSLSSFNSFKWMPPLSSFIPSPSSTVSSNASPFFVNNSLFCFSWSPRLTLVSLVSLLGLGDTLKYSCASNWLFPQYELCQAQPVFQQQLLVQFVSTLPS